MAFAKISLIVISSLTIPFINTSFAAPNPNAGLNPNHASVLKHWDNSRRNAAVPRDLLIDPRGQGYMRVKQGELIPYGHTMKPLAGKPKRSRDSTAPVISNLSPDAGVLDTTVILAATVTDNVAVSRVDFYITGPTANPTSYSVSASSSNAGGWTAAAQDLTDGKWCWYVTARDTAKRGGNRSTSQEACFDIDTGDNVIEPPAADEIVVNGNWSIIEQDVSADVQWAAGRIYFEMPADQLQRQWNGYVCSGTVVKDSTTGRSLILTAAHCVYDDANKAFARNVLFIPNQSDSGSGTDTNCSNDVIGCWSTAFGVVDRGWAQVTFPNNIEWDHAYYVVNDSGAHSGNTASSDILADAVPAISINFVAPRHDEGGSVSSAVDYSYGLGYSYADDPHFMYCAEGMTTVGAVNWWLPSCGLSGGASGGPWLQDNGNGVWDIISVNSWGYISSPGMAGPKLNSALGECLYNIADSTAAPSSLSDGDAGIITDCP
ncbi:serine protease [Moritella sp. Urea-trap-13]|uniref:trypsin-like serine peptidase n=1 Tax=Moritella sp. Urea-trap-13 TaxID=2058327 RepID=UPI001E52FAFE|nr:hypothetical protein [Moritella sp. Urea-trap-13]